MAASRHHGFHRSFEAGHVGDVEGQCVLVDAPEETQQPGPGPCPRSGRPGRQTTKRFCSSVRGLNHEAARWGKCGVPANTESACSQGQGWFDCGGLRIWWNWQTRYFEVVVPKGVQVQVLLSAPTSPAETSRNHRVVRFPASEQVFEQPPAVCPQIPTDRRRFAQVRVIRRRKRKAEEPRITRITRIKRESVFFPLSSVPIREIRGDEGWSGSTTNSHNVATFEVVSALNRIVWSP